LKRFIYRFLGIKNLHERLEFLEKRISELEKIADERDSLWLFIEEVRNQEIETAKIIQEELEKVMIRNIKPFGDA